MAFKGELFTTGVTLDNRAYFFNVKENRAGDVFLQIVESKKETKDDRRAIVIFEDDMLSFTRGLDQSLRYIESSRKERAKAREQRFKARKVFRSGSTKGAIAKEPSYKGADGPKGARETRGAKAYSLHKTGRVHVVSKKGNVDIPHPIEND